LELIRQWPQTPKHRAQQYHDAIYPKQKALKQPEEWQTQAFDQ